MYLQTSHQSSTQNKGLFNLLDIKQLVQQSLFKAQKNNKGQIVEPLNYQDNVNDLQEKKQNYKYSFDTIPKTIYYLDHQLISTDQNAVEKSMLELSKFFQFLFKNPCHRIKSGQIINIQAGQNQIQRKVSIQSLNPLIARMLDMFLNSKIFVFKNYIADILIQYAFVIKKIFIKEELLQVLNKGIKGYDEYTRIISVKIIPSFIEMFQKDLVGFEYIIHKIQSFDQKSHCLNISHIVQKLSFIECMKQMLQKSEVLSSFFIKNINEQAFMNNFLPIQKCMKVNQMSILRFCEFCLNLEINTSDSLDLFKSILKIYKNRSKQIQNIDIEIHKQFKQYISKLFVKFFDKNFKVLEVIFVQGIQSQIELDLEVINKKFQSYDQHQKKYILKDCPSKLRQFLCHYQQHNIRQKTQNLQQRMFLKFYSKLNSFDLGFDHHHNNFDIIKCLIVKQRRLEEFIELCESQKNQQITQLVKIWLNIYGLMLSLVSNLQNQQMQNNFQSTKVLIQKIASQCQNLQEQVFVLAEVFLLLQKSYKSQNIQHFLKQTIWENTQKLPSQNKHFLKCTYLSEKTLIKLIF